MFKLMTFGDRTCKQPITAFATGELVFVDTNLTKSE